MRARRSGRLVAHKDGQPGSYTVEAEGRTFWLGQHGGRWLVTEHYQRHERGKTIGWQRTVGWAPTKAAAVELCQREVTQ